MSLVGIDDMHKLGANRAAVGRLKTIYYFFESRTVSADVQATCLESGHKIAGRQLVKLQSKIWYLITLNEIQRIQSSTLMSTLPIG